MIAVSSIRMQPRPSAGCLFNPKTTPNVRQIRAFGRNEHRKKKYHHYGCLLSGVWTKTVSAQTNRGVVQIADEMPGKGEINR